VQELVDDESEIMFRRINQRVSELDHRGADALSLSVRE
jgi:hypothetical protein